MVRLVMVCCGIWLSYTIRRAELRVGGEVGEVGKEGGEVGGQRG